MTSAQIQKSNEGARVAVGIFSHHPEQLPLFTGEPIGEFFGTNNPRHIRTINALLLGPQMREDLDHFAGCSNGPQLVSDLRESGLELPCRRMRRIDRDSKVCAPGQYYFTDNDRRLILAWKMGVQL